MFIDFLLTILLVMAVIKGLRQGFIVAVFSTLAVFIGLIAAIKLSAITANYLHEKAHLSMSWLPLLSFALVMFITILLVKIIARIIERTAEFALMGWANKLAGVALYIFLYGMVFSVLLFYLSELKIISSQTIQESKSYSYIQPLAPKIIDGIGNIIPVFKNLFSQLENFFSSIADKAK